MRIIAILAIAVGAIWAAKTGRLTPSKFKRSKLDGLRDRATNMAGSATEDLGKKAEDVADRVRAATH